MRAWLSVFVLIESEVDSRRASTMEVMNTCTAARVQGSFQPHLHRTELLVVESELLLEIVDDHGIFVVGPRGAPAHHLIDRAGRLLLRQVLLHEDVGGVARVAARLDSR